MLFKRRFKVKEEMIPRMNPSSKIELKQMCLIASKGDLENAQKLYEFMIKDMEELPVFEPARPSTMEQVKSGMMDTFNWVNENQENIANWIGIAKSIFGKKGGGGVPPAASQAVNPVPPIN